MIPLSYGTVRVHNNASVASEKGQKRKEKNIINIIPIHWHRCSAHLFFFYDDPNGFTSKAKYCMPFDWNNKEMTLFLPIQHILVDV